MPSLPSFVWYPFTLAGLVVSSAFRFAYAAVALPLSYFSWVSTLLHSLLITPVVKLVDVVVFSLLIPVNAALYTLGIDSSDLPSVWLHLQFFLTTAYHFVAVAILLGVVVGVVTGVELGVISYVLTPRRKSAAKSRAPPVQATPATAASTLAEPVASHRQLPAAADSPPSLIANVPNKQLPLKFSNFKIDIKYDTPSPEARGAGAPQERVITPVELLQAIESFEKSNNRSSGVSTLSYDATGDSLLKKRYDAGSVATDNDLFTVRTDDTDVTYPTNEIKNYKREA